MKRVVRLVRVGQGPFFNKMQFNLQRLNRLRSKKGRAQKCWPRSELRKNESVSCCVIQ